MKNKIVHEHFVLVYEGRQFFHEWDSNNVNCKDLICWTKLFLT
jgi:hypothetical protein